MTPLIVSCAVFWLKTQFVTKVDFTAERNRLQAKLDADKVERDGRYDSLNNRAADHETRLRMVEADVAKPPSRHTLNNAIATMQGAIHSLGRSIDDMRHNVETQGADTRREMGTLNSYLHTIIEKHIG